MILVIAYHGVAAGMQQQELAGRPFADYLTAHLQSMQQAEPYVFDPENRVPDHKNRIDANFEWGSDVLLIRADAWFSNAAVKRLLAMDFTSSKTSVVCESLKRPIRGEDILALYLPAETAKSLLCESEPHAFLQKLERIGQDAAAADLVDVLELDPVLPPVRVKDLLDLTLLEGKIFFQRACDALRAGVRIRDPNKISIRGTLQCGAGVEIDLDVILEGRVILADGVRIGAHSIIANATIGAHTQVKPFSIVEDAVVGANTFIGPYGRVRPGSTIGDSVQIGNFVEIKNAGVGNGSRINHLAFIGDAVLERDVTIGAGTITCNHNGVGASQTHIRAGAYIGSGTLLVAPLLIGENATIGAGSTITHDAPAEKLTLARSRQVTSENWTRPVKKTVGK
jgi:acetyltransferase-like isoleucine patch superfamily enzyme